MVEWRVAMSLCQGSIFPIIECLYFKVPCPPASILPWWAHLRQAEVGKQVHRKTHPGVSLQLLLVVQAASSLSLCKAVVIKVVQAFSEGELWRVRHRTVSFLGRLQDQDTKAGAACQGSTGRVICEKPPATSYQTWPSYFLLLFFPFLYFFLCTALPSPPQISSILSSISLVSIHLLISSFLYGALHLYSYSFHSLILNSYLYSMSSYSRAVL